MGSPFPGMDPWLEDPAIFPDLHGNFITELRKAINNELPPPYYAAINNRVWLDLSLRHIEPDVDVLYPSAPTKKTGTSRKSRSVVETAAGPLVIDAPGLIQNDDMEEWFLEIFAKPGNEQLVTSIELLSMSNKRQGNQGRELYLKKQQEILNGKANLVEIDLLRGGVHTTLIPRALIEAKYGPFDYHVCVHQMDKTDKYFVYPWKLEMHLPLIQIPLVPGDPAVTVALQPIFDACYDDAKYERRVPYRTTKPSPRLAKDQKAWADKILAAGKRKKRAGPSTREPGVTKRTYGSRPSLR
jgi:Protein of unknown function (DUF4058)